MSKKRIIIISILFIIAIIGYITLKETKPTKLENDTHLQPNTEFIYYINVNYDGIDEQGTESSEDTSSNVNSSDIFVEDKIPEGLIFLGFVDTGNGSIGAVSQNENKQCLGEVENGTNGLIYNESTNTVSFQVKNLQAGCKLTVGIRTMTPNVDDPNTEIIEQRRDFYNYATAKENNELIKSNTVHAWIGSDTVTKYKVIYEYTGSNIPNIYTPPQGITYAEGTTISVIANPNLDNYSFSGWQTTDVVVTDGKFVMPNKNVKFTGYFTENPKYRVNFNIEGTIPSNYATPNTKYYYENNLVKINELKRGDIIDNYRFLGWQSTDVLIDDNNEFTMPNKDITLTGSFEEITYKVCYEFLNSTLTPPSCENYHYGESVTLIDMNEYLKTNNITTLNIFQGWNKENTFIMPASDLNITGSWILVNGYFKPTIEFYDNNASTKKYHDIGDIEDIGIKITNNESYTLKDIIIKLDNAILPSSNYEICNITCIDTTNYTITNNILKINELPPNSIFKSKEENITITFSKNDLGSTLNTEIYILGAITDNNYIYEDDPNSKDTKTYNMKSKLNICVGDSSNRNQLFNYNISSSNIDELDSNYYETKITLKSNECQTIYIPIGTYTIEQITPEEYTLNNVNGSINQNKGTLQCELNKTYNIHFINKYSKKGFFHSYGNIIKNIFSKVGAP